MNSSIIERTIDKRLLPLLSTKTMAEYERGLLSFITWAMAVKADRFPQVALVVIKRTWMAAELIEDFDAFRRHARLSVAGDPIADTLRDCISGGTDESAAITAVLHVHDGSPLMRTHLLTGATEVLIATARHLNAWPVESCHDCACPGH